tara:strand:+ start:9 stop:653 length:645 start_codon:yes stop_codon:yes gene_type:complete
MVYRIQETKPSLKRGGAAVDTTDIRPALAFDSSQDIIMFSEESWLSILWSWVKSAFLFFVAALVIMVVLYVTLAATLVFVANVDNEPVVVARGTFLGGIPQAGDTVFVGSGTPGNDPLTKLQEAFIGVPDPKVATVLTEPGDVVSAGNGTVTVNGQSQSGTFVNSSGAPSGLGSTALTNQALVECVTGECEPGTFFLIPLDQVYGEAVMLQRTV